MPLPTPAPKKILIIDLYSASNQGDAAIFAGLLGSLKKEVSINSIFILHTWFPHFVNQLPELIVHDSLITHRIGNIKNTLKTVFVCLLFFILSVLARLNLNIFTLLPARYAVPFKDFVDADLVIAMGGGFYNDNYWAALPGRLGHLIIGKLLGKPVVISAHSFGPFRRKFARVLTRFTLNRIDAICARDHAGFEELRALGVSTSKIKKVTDSAWLLDNLSELENAPHIKVQAATFPQTLLISLSARHWQFYRGYPDYKQAHSNYVDVLAKTLDSLITKYQIFVIFLSTYPADIETALEIKQKMKQPQNLLLPSKTFNALELKTMYKLVQLHIGTRMHSVILALSVGTPCIGIAYEPKLASLMQEIGLQDYIIDIEEIEHSSLLNAVELLLENRLEYQTTIKHELPGLRRLARQNAKILTQFLR